MHRYVCIIYIAVRAAYADDLCKSARVLESGPVQIPQKWIQNGISNQEVIGARFQYISTRYILYIPAPAGLVEYQLTLYQHFLPICTNFS